MHNKYEGLIEHLFEGIYVVNLNREIVFWNAGSEYITGYKADEVVHHFCYNNILNHVDIEGNHLCKGGCPLHKTMETGEKIEAQVFLTHKQGHRVPVEIRTTPLYDSENNIVGAIEAFTDTRYREHLYVENKRLQELLITDELTNVANRRYVEFQLSLAVKEYEEFGFPVGLLFFDIDHFKDFNDQYGHAVGDHVLKVVAQTINNNVRSNDTFGRWGGEEFILISRNINKMNLYHLAEKLRMLIAASRISNDVFGDLRVTVSIGGAMYQEGMSELNLVQKADENMYKAKKNGRNQTYIDIDGGKE